MISLIRLLSSTPDVRELAFENLALRQQSVVLKRHGPRVRLRNTPEALREYTARGSEVTTERLLTRPNDHPRLRPYQREANAAIEQAILNRKWQMLVAMATGTGKTFTMLDDVYRLMKSGVAKRILFLVDRRALAAQDLCNRNRGGESSRRVPTHGQQAPPSKGSLVGQNHSLGPYLRNDVYGWMGVWSLRSARTLPQFAWRKSPGRNT